jgi:hypothetical protein
MNDTAFDREIFEYLHAYRGAAIPIENIARAVAPNDDHGPERVKTRILALAGEGRIERSRVFPDRWLSASTERVEPVRDTGTPGACVADRSTGG